MELQKIKNTFFFITQEFLYNDINNSYKYVIVSNNITDQVYHPKNIKKKKKKLNV